MGFALFKRLPLIILISAFIALDFTLLFINLNLTYQINQDAKIINLTGRQRMLSQKVAKHMLLLTYSVNDNRQESTQALLQASRLFNSTLIALQHGGTVTDADGETIELTGLHDEPSQQYIAEAQSLWVPMFQLIQKVEQGDYPDSHQVDLFAAKDSNEILTLMNQLTVRAEHISKTNTESLRIAQIVIFLLVLANFFTIVIRLIYVNRSQEKLQGQMKQMVQNLAEAVLLLDIHRTIVFANDAAARILDKSADELIGTSITELIGPVSKDKNIQIRHRHYRINIAQISTEPHTLRMISLIDITEQHFLKKQSTQDALTGLLNRIGLTEAYVQLSATVDEVCCMFLDLDGFKIVNDQYGHAIGDMALHIVSQRFSGCLKSNDILARIGGDEFVIIINKPSSENSIEKLCQRIEESIKRPMVIDGNTCRVGVSIGIQYSRCHEHSLEEIIRMADQKMYQIKQRKKQLLIDDDTAV